MLKRLSVSMFLVAAIACASKGTAISPSPAAPTATVPTPATLSLSGAVITSFTRIPIPDATVSIVDGPNAGRSATTDASGNFVFTELQPSQFRVTVSAANYFPSPAPVNLVSNQTQTFFLIPTGPTIALTGQVTDVGTSAPISGAIVRINGRYSTTTDSLGHYSLTGYLDLGAGSVALAFANGYEGFERYIRGMSSQSFRLRRIERITGGDSWSVTVTPDDTLCNNNLQDPTFSVPGSGYLCRTVRVVVPSDGVMTVEALSTPGGVHPPLEIETVGVSPCCSERMGNPTSIQVTAATELMVNVELAESSTISQSFTLNTSIAPQR
jgi:hypothetical protein